jgi:hypothetical protein
MKFRVQIHYNFKGRCLSEPMEVHADSHEDAARQSQTAGISESPEDRFCGGWWKRPE